MRLSGSSIAWLAVYALVMALVAAAAAEARRQTVAALSRPDARAEWQAWRNDVVQRNTAEGPVARRVPPPGEPPALVLLRDYFPAALGVILLIASAWFAFFALVGRGLWRARRGANSAADSSRQVGVASARHSQQADA